MDGHTVSIPVSLALIWLLNFGISIWNARIVGTIWAEAKHFGGVMRFLAWCGAIMAFCGFFWCYAVIEAFVGNWLFPETVTPDVVMGIFAMAYIMIIFPVLGTGFAITAHSIYVAWKSRDFGSMATAGWNTFAQIKNTYDAFEGVPMAWKILGGIFGDSDDGSDTLKKGAGLVVIGIIALAFVAAAFTTVGIIMHYAGSRKVPDHVTGMGSRRAA